MKKKTPNRLKGRRYEHNYTYKMFHYKVAIQKFHMLSSNNGLHEGDFVELFSNNPYEPTKEETMRAFDQKYGSHPSGHVTMWIEEIE